MVNVAQLVEHQIVALVAVGSIPTIHPVFALGNFFEVELGYAWLAPKKNFEKQHQNSLHES
jgi:hypothetical protein